MKKKESGFIDKNLLFTLLLGALILVSAVQAYQVSSIAGKISDDSVKIGSASSHVNPTSSGSGSVPSNIQDLPSMVGGC